MIKTLLVPVWNSFYSSLDMAKQEQGKHSQWKVKEVQTRQPHGKTILLVELSPERFIRYSKIFKIRFACIARNKCERPKYNLFFSLAFLLFG